MEKGNQANTDLTEKKQNGISKDSRSISLPVPKDGQDELSEVQFDNPLAMAHNNQDFMLSIYGLLSEVSGQENQSPTKLSLLQQAMKRKSVTIKEAIEGFWGAYSDPYVKDGNIEWRHIYKHIEKMRENEPDTYTSLKPYKG